ncbi:MAG: Rrf2 family transcriptional regulator [Bacteroidota bacterium]|nr:Rrf2 family transcriptional regulator [Bacteroidota bacterium]
MMFSKSFDYALRGILYVSLMSGAKKRVRVEEISLKIAVPKHFLGKIMNKVVKKGILDSTKGPFGGFSLNEKTSATSLLTLLKTVDGFQPFSYCVLKMKKCNPSHPCPMHSRVAHLRDGIYEALVNTTIGDLANGNKPHLLRSITI